MEQQAQDRIHRLGQYKPIHVTRFVIAGSIEERILKLQVKQFSCTHTHTHAYTKGFSQLAWDTQPVSCTCASCVRLSR